jgi:hypothetical protein
MERQVINSRDLNHDEHYDLIEMLEEKKLVLLWLNKNMIIL